MHYECVAPPTAPTIEISEITGYEIMVIEEHPLEPFLPPYKTESGDKFTRVTLYPKKALKEMTQEEKVQACYQHACLLYKDGLELNNASLRGRFELDAKKSAVASRIIADTIDAGLIKVANEDIQSRKYATYVPYYG